MERMAKESYPKDKEQRAKENLVLARHKLHEWKGSGTLALPLLVLWCMAFLVLCRGGELSSCVASPCSCIILSVHPDSAGVGRLLLGR